MLCIPADEHFSVCSIYLPNSIMLPHLDILDVLSGHLPSVSVEDARASGEPLYSTPNIHYAPPPPPPAPRVAATIP